MTRLIYIAVFHRTADDDDEKKSSKSIRLAQSNAFSQFNWFARGTAGDGIKFACRTVIDRIKFNTRYSINSGDEKAPFVVHSFIQSSNRLGCTVVTDEEYDKRVAFVLVNKIITKYEKLNIEYEDFTKDQNEQAKWLDDFLKVYTNPTDADLLHKIQAQVDGVKDLANKNIEQILKNGETVDSLVETSDELEKQSKLFIKQAKKANSCCKLF